MVLVAAVNEPTFSSILSSVRKNKNSRWRGLRQVSTIHPVETYQKYGKTQLIPGVGVSCGRQRLSGRWTTLLRLHQEDGGGHGGTTSPHVPALGPWTARAGALLVSAAHCRCGTLRRVVQRRRREVASRILNSTHRLRPDTHPRRPQNSKRRDSVARRTPSWCSQQSSTATTPARSTMHKHALCTFERIHQS